MQKSQNFETIYNETYDDLRRFVVVKCSNFEDVNDIIQETYIEFYQTMQKKVINDHSSYLFGIAKNKLKKYYKLKSRVKDFFSSIDIHEQGVIDSFADNFELDEHVFRRLAVDDIWAYLNSKNITTAKIFYLYYAEELTIKQVADELSLSESTVKNHLYRSLKELNSIFGKDSD